MIIAVISDTHLAYPNATLERIFESYCLDADMLLHCGDCVGEETWAYLNSHPRFFAVQGNCDLPPLRGALPPQLELECAGFTLGMAHGWGPRSLVGETVAQLFSGVHIVCYGHTHIRDWRKLSQGPWLLNPGSLFLPRSGAAGMVRLYLQPKTLPEVEWINV
ncbi:MAG: metallophosphoesterase family protein [Desulfovibrionales bacterium]|nr:metallophosphoesterase family protein [Desulfovibrionales bacterium]